MDVSLGSLNNDVSMDEENLIRPRYYGHYDSEVCPGWLKEILPPLVGMGRHQGIGAECCRPNAQTNPKET
jgi:hypothetical protein